MFFLPSVGFVDSCAMLVTHPVTIDILLNALRHFNLSCMLYVCTHAAFLVAFFSFLRISDLVPILWMIFYPQQLFSSAQGCFLHTHWRNFASLQKQNYSVSLALSWDSLPFIPNSFLCPLIALSRYLHSVPAPLFVVSQGARLRAYPRGAFHSVFESLRSFCRS